MLISHHVPGSACIMVKDIKFANPLRYRNISYYNYNTLINRLKEDDFEQKVNNPLDLRTVSLDELESVLYKHLDKITKKREEESDK